MVLDPLDKDIQRSLAAMVPVRKSKHTRDTEISTALAASSSKIENNSAVVESAALDGILKKWSTELAERYGESQTAIDEQSVGMVCKISGMSLIESTKREKAEEVATSLPESRGDSDRVAMREMSPGKTSVISQVSNTYLLASVDIVAFGLPNFIALTKNDRDHEQLMEPDNENVQVKLVLSSHDK